MPKHVAPARFSNGLPQAHPDRVPEIMHVQVSQPGPLDDRLGEAWLRCTTPGWVALGSGAGQSAGLMFSGACSLSTNESDDPRKFSAGTPHLTTAAPAFFRIADVMRITALSRATVYRRIADGIFPPPVHLGGRACGWTPAALQAWIDDPGGYRTPRAPHDDMPTGCPRHQGRGGRQQSP